jgi:phosphotransferase system enzyme I (PtsP)
MSMLARLRQIVQEVGSESDLESVLSLTVRRIRETMSTEVCSIYLTDSQTDRYVLRATEGLNQDAVGKVSLSSTEGIVGLVGSRAEPINLEDAFTHPSFVYLQSTGEERFHAFLGVPIIHQRKVHGVLVVQQREVRRFDESEEAFMVTLSAQLAGVIAHAEATGSILDVFAVAKQDDEPVTAKRFVGIAGAPGVAIGNVYVATLSADLRSVPDKPANNIPAELQDFEHALVQVREDIQKVSDSLATRLRTEEQALFEVYLRMLDDNAIPSEVRGKIEAGNWAQGALREVIQSHVRQFSDMEDPYLRERATDIRDLGRRLLSAMQQDGAERVPDFPDNTVLIADDLSPAMLGLVPEDKLVGMVSVTGSGSSHAAILARSMGIPTLMGVVELPYTKLDGRQVIVDGYSGRIYVDPTDDLLDAYSSILIEERAIEANLDQLRDLPAETQDGFNQTLWVNTGLTADVERAVKRGAEGIGLYRTEIPFMIRDTFPSELEQADSYRRQLEAFAPKPVTMRTLDIGGDKALPYFPIEEENPFLGWRGIRVTLDHPEIFLVQVRAMLRASEGLNNLRIMLPMISSVQEVEAALEQINQAFNELLEEGLDLQKPEIGVMIEVPAAVYQIGRFAPLIDFVSVGSNDLTQYLLAVDRNNPRVADLYTTYHPSVLQALQLIANEAHKYHKQVSICGEMAADPGGALLLMAMGYDVLSMNSTNLPKVKLAIRSVEYKDAALLLGQVMKMDESSDIHLLLRETLQNAGLTQLTRPVIPGND